MSVRIFKRQSVWFIDWWQDGQRFRRSLRTKDRSIALKAKRIVERRLAVGDEPLGTPRGRTVKVYLEEWIERAEHRLRRSTVSGYRRGIETAVKLIGHRALNGVTREDAFAVTRELATGPRGPRSESSITSLLAALQVAFNDALHLGLVTSNPFGMKGRLVRQVAHREHKPGQEIVPYTQDELGEILAVADLDDQVAILVGVRAGLRRSEVLALRRQDLDLEGRRLFVRQRLSRGQIETTKSRAGKRDVPMTDDLVAACRRLIARQNELALKEGRPAPDLLLPARNRMFETTTHQEEDRFGGRFIRLLAKAGVERRTGAPFHRLRHTFVSELLVAGVPTYHVSRWAGHASTEFTERVYGHWIPRPDDHRLIGVLDSGTLRHKKGTNRAHGENESPTGER